MTHTRISHIISIVTCLTMVASAQQAPIEILLDDTTLGEEVAEGKFVEAGGVIMAVTQVVATDGGDVAAVDDYGILFGTDTDYNDAVSLTISFNMDVRVVYYEIGSREDVPGRFFGIRAPHFLVNDGRILKMASAETRRSSAWTVRAREESRNVLSSAKFTPATGRKTSFSRTADLSVTFGSTSLEMILMKRSIERETESVVMN